ncbi:creatininase family protein [Roseobacter ponti]|uniref:Creatininase family protein n=1 Tax=Roseobacter ponti TaxID=1891787 RepID=A0A858SST5_9RHOB|nr:creatininase family protein [Roseobacter ponti]QJF51735.1 creatininase family protein [Roseobacter ponti]
MVISIWAETCAKDFEDVDPIQTIAILPTAATEQHGPHLPLGTDSMIAEGMLKELQRQNPADLDLRLLPVQAIGKSDEHIWAAGTLTLSAETALSTWTEICMSVARAGVRKIVIVNSHGGNLDLLSILVRRLRIDAAMLAVRCQWGAFGAPEDLYSEQENTHGLHGGDVETSLMLAFRPETVRMEFAKDFRSSAETSLVPPTGPVASGWIARDLNPDGVVGEAHLATAQKGRTTASHQVRGFIEMLRAVAGSPLPDA